ncbi:hypothetical protein F8M41_002564 [Gigaspora margarita]|uniref:Uncharacterized protein n=1 Tax=Gigaspora margarita TaxID=4874 RepID=A0A8H4ESD5_GIGMA|nr:hypothetical protein F8M41_002564 [Gigaspora margarita]
MTERNQKKEKQKLKELKEQERQKLLDLYEELKKYLKFLYQVLRNEIVSILKNPEKKIILLFPIYYNELPKRPPSV